MVEDGLGRQLLAVARHAIAGELALPVAAPETDAAMEHPGATFVTLVCGDRLRGCIGSLKATRPLGVDVRENALAAAFRDPRFAPLTAAELGGTLIEVSLLSAPQIASFASEAELRARLTPFEDGVALELGDRRATFLPQVWELLPEPREFLAALKEKAKLPADFWSPRLEVSLYRVTKWKENELLSRQAAP
ncbi:MAG TPA: AmmeMemoRadiSam system protein A [Casimicrobiaceae bacterium]|nr:AmmeMemoRadiSam system protein A [Casimicrobiaceae bacterium]